jgi:hypothetical protein
MFAFGNLTSQGTSRLSWLRTLEPYGRKSENMADACHPAVCLPFFLLSVGYDASASIAGLHGGVRCAQGAKGRKSDNMADYMGLRSEYLTSNRLA